MSELKTSNPLALHFLMNEDLYRFQEEEILQPEALHTNVAQVKDETIEAREETADQGYEYYGENNRYILLLVDSPDHKVMAQKELDALQNTLSAKKLEMKDVAIVNLAHYPDATFQKLKEFFVCSSLVLLGVSCKRIKMQEVPLNLITTVEGTKVLATYSFAEMLDSNDKKRAFWNEMKKL